MPILVYLCVCVCVCTCVFLPQITLQSQQEERPAGCSPIPSPCPGEYNPYEPTMFYNGFGYVKLAKPIKPCSGENSQGRSVRDLDTNVCECQCERPNAHGAADPEAHWQLPRHDGEQDPGQSSPPRGRPRAPPPQPELRQATLPAVHTTQHPEHLPSPGGLRLFGCSMTLFLPSRL